MASYLERLVIRGRADAGVAAPLAAPPLPPAVSEVVDPFEAAPVVELTPPPAPIVERRADVVPVVAPPMRAPAAAALPVPAPATERETVEREHLVVRERETVLHTSSSTVAIPQAPVARATLEAPRIEPAPFAPTGAPIDRELPVQPLRAVAPAVVTITPPPQRLALRERTHEVRELVREVAPTVAAPAPIARTPMGSHTLVAPQPPAAVIAPPQPRLTIGRIVVEVVPPAVAAAPAPPPQTTVVVRTAAAVPGSILHRGFGLGQS